MTTTAMVSEEIAHEEVNNATTMNGVERSESNVPPENGEKAKESVAAIVQNDNANDISVADADAASSEGNNDAPPPPPDSADDNDAAEPPSSKNAAASTISAPNTPPPPPPPSRTTTTTSTASSANTGSGSSGSGGFFSRINSLGSNAAPILGDVYDRAQKRAVQLREQAVTEVERLRQQREEQAAAAAAAEQHEKEFVLPPATGTLVIGSGSLPVAALSGDETKEVKAEVVATDLENKQAAEKDVVPSSSTSQSTITSPTKQSQQPKKSTIDSISSPLRDAFSIVRKTSADAAKELIFPIDAFAEGSHPSSSSPSSSSYSQDDSSDDSNASNDDSAASVEEEARSNKSAAGGGGGGGSNNATVDDNKLTHSPTRTGSSGNATAATATDTLTPTRFAAFSNAVGMRYRKLKETTSFDSSPLPQHQQQQQQREAAASPVVVGGADRVGGLRHFQLDGIFDGAALPPSLPLAGKKTDLLSQPPPGRDNLVMQTGGQWTMASNRGPNAVSPTAATNTNNDASSTAATSETASEDGLLFSPPTPTANGGKPPVAGATAPGGRTSRSSYYEHAVRSVLQPGQRALFFGKGTMGVVLKPTYLASWRGKDGQGLLSPTMNKKGGVFIDLLIPGGHAEKSGVVFVGDQVIRIGSVNVENMTLEEVVNVICETKRPNIMVLTSEHDVQIVDGVVDEANDIHGEVEEMKKKKAFVSPLDLAFGFANKLVAEGGEAQDRLEKGQVLNPTISMNSLLDDDGEEDEESVKDAGDDSEEEEVFFGSPAKQESGSNVGVDIPASGANEQNESENSESSNDVPLPNADSDNDSDKLEAKSETLRTQSSNSSAATIFYDIETLKDYASHRTNTHGTDTEKQKKRSLLLKRAALFNSDFRNALRHSLLECVMDPRRYSFLEHFFKNYQSSKELEFQERKGKKQEATADDNDVTSSKNQRRLLELYLELCKFHDITMVCSVSDRENLLSYARKISTLFLPDEGADQQDSCLPEYVAHVALGGMEKVQAVRFALRDEDEFFESDTGGDGFDIIRSSLEAFLSTQESYLSFLISHDCARMRAYLRGSYRFLGIEPQMFLKANSSSSMHHNFLLHAILHLICMRETNTDSKDCDENFVKNDALMLNSGKRNMGAASMLSCAIFIMRALQKSMAAAVEALIEDGMTGTSTNLKYYSALIEDVQFFWEVFIAPAGGSLSSLALSQDTQQALDAARRLIVSSVDKVQAEEKSSDEVAIARVLSSAEVSSSVHTLAEALLREYTLKIYPNFRRHIFHEWACKEANTCLYNGRDHSSSNGEYLASSEFNGLKEGWMNRFLRQMELPDGISLHRGCGLLPKENVSTSATTPEMPDCFHNGDVALVFGSDYEDEAAEQASSRDDDNLRRFSCVSVQPETDGPTKKVLLPEDIPPIFESYAMVPPFHERPFQGMLQDEKNNRMSIDGWEVSLTNFVIPSPASGASDDDKWMYCVSLVLRKTPNARPQISEQEISNECVSELHHDGSANQAAVSEFESPLFATETKDGRALKVSKVLKEFNCKLKANQSRGGWSQQFGQGATIGLALISSRNVMQAMRETLFLLYNDFCSVKSSSKNIKAPRHLCQPLVDILGVLSHSQVEATSLSCLMQPYIAFTTSRWVHRPLPDQSDIFSEAAGMQLLQALPPVSLALAFVTLLLEQKVVFSSSRRGMLMSASFAMMQLFKPLKWAHLQVPLVPVSMMNELIHYPAPFMLGIPTDEKESAAILGALPSDVTLIDLDVGRVILAPVFAKDDTKFADGASALRSQVLFLAESLGGAFGAAIYRNSWCSDSPLQVVSNERRISSNQSEGNFSGVLSICQEFISELLSGVHSCCMRIGEKHDHDTNTRKESAIIFDEDRFYHIKKLRAEGLYQPLIQKPDTKSAQFTFGLDHFDLIFETFLRTQCLSTYISDGDKESMLFW
ncbi:hypothetical protein ACHAXR_012149 [Thalassiosira sp. AJA248-18]